MNWTIYPIARLEELAPTWNALNDGIGGLPFLHTRFLLPLCREYGDSSLKIALCENGEAPVAMSLLTRNGTGQWETFLPSQLPLGAWVMRSGENFERLLSGLASRMPGFALAIGIWQQDPDCVPRPTTSAHLATLDYIDTARLPISGSFDDYWNQRGRNLRQNMRKQRAKLQKDGIRTRLELLTRPDEVGSAIADYGQLESAGWKAEGGTAIHPDNAQGRFYRAMLEAYCRAGLGRIYRYRFGERVVALDLCIEGGGALVILKTTYDESIKTISPAFLMREEWFRGVFGAQRVKRIEFYGKVMDWHLRWTGDVRTLYHVNYFRFRWVSKLRTIAARFNRSKVSEPQINTDEHG